MNISFPLHYSIAHLFFYKEHGNWDQRKFSPKISPFLVSTKNINININVILLICIVHTLLTDLYTYGISVQFPNHSPKEFFFCWRNGKATSNITNICYNLRILCSRSCLLKALLKKYKGCITFSFSFKILMPICINVSVIFILTVIFILPLPPLSFFENWKKCHDFGKKSPNCVYSWVQSSIQNVVLRVSRRKSSKILPCGRDHFFVFLVKSLLKCPNSTKPPLPRKISGCASVQGRTARESLITVDNLFSERWAFFKRLIR